MRKVLVVDDDDQIIKMLQLLLRPRGFEITAAADGQAGLQMALDKLPDLIIADIMMPRMDGPTFIGQLRNKLPDKKIPVIFLTGLVSKTEEKGQNHFIGNEYFVAKPFSTSTMLELINRVLK